MQQYAITVTEKMPADSEDIERTAVVLAADEAEAIGAAIRKLYGKDASFNALGVVDGSNVTDRGSVWRRTGDGGLDRVASMVWIAVEVQETPTGRPAVHESERRVNKTFRLSPETLDQLDALAGWLDIKPSALVDELIAARYAEVVADQARYTEEVEANEAEAREALVAADEAERAKWIAENP